MRIGWLHDLPLSDGGGANVTNSIMIAKGRELGHEIDFITPTEIAENNYEALKKYDFLILNNINLFGLEPISWIVKNCKYIKYEHDYCYCKFRKGNCKPPCHPAKIFIELFSNSVLNVFFSPLQLNIFKKAFGQTMRDAICIPAPFEINKWFPDFNIQQQDAYLYAGVIMHHKGLNHIIDFADKLKAEGKVFHFAGKAIEKKLLERIEKNHTYLGEIPHDEMPKLMRKYKNFVINPQMPETFGTVVLEAIASGCNIIKFDSSSDIGLESYEMAPDMLMRAGSIAPTEFWHKVMEAVK